MLTRYVTINVQCDSDHPFSKCKTVDNLMINCVQTAVAERRACITTIGCFGGNSKWVVRIFKKICMKSIRMHRNVKSYRCRTFFQHELSDRFVVDRAGRAKCAVLIFFYGRKYPTISSLSFHKTYLCYLLCN